jgi:pimeloyl-ACP methyl ester carboxylesterase
MRASIFWLLLTLILCAASVAGADEGFLPVKGVKIRYLTQGTGEPVLLIHGLYSSIEKNWKFGGVLDAVSKGHQLIALDMPGHGQSDRPEDDFAYGVQMVEDVIAVMDHLHVPKAHIVGYSMGGMVALKLLELHPNRALSCLLGGMGWLREGGVLQRWWLNLPDKKGEATPSACARGMGKLALTEDAVRKIKVPVRMLVGAQDPVKRLYVEPLAAVRSDWSVVEIPGGHIDAILKPEFRDGVTAWLTKNAGHR